MTTFLKSKNFELVIAHGVGVNDTPWTRLNVLPKDLAKKHVVDISLDFVDKDFVGKPVQYKYTGEVHINHGMRMRVDSLDETLEYIEVLKEAVDFAKDVSAWIDANPEWKA